MYARGVKAKRQREGTAEELPTGKSGEPCTGKHVLVVNSRCHTQSVKEDDQIRLCEEAEEHWAGCAFGRLGIEKLFRSRGGGAIILYNTPVGKRQTMRFIAVYIHGLSPLSFV